MRKNRVGHECSVLKHIATYLGNEIGVPARHTAKRVGLWMFALVVATMLAGQAVGQTTYTWTQNATGTQDWTVGANWASSTPFVSGSGNQLRFSFTGVAGNATTVMNVPTTLSMNVLTLAGTGPNSTSGSRITVGTSASTWTIGDGTTSTVNLDNIMGGGSSDRDIRYTIAPNLTLNQTTTTFTGSSPSITGARFSGNITEAAAGYGITKQGTSLLIFSGSNTYSGTTAVNAGQLRLNSANALPGGIGATGGTSALTLNGGVVELANGDFLRNLGTGSAQFRVFGGTSGFSALGAPRFLTVNGDASQELVWGGTSFNPSPLVLNNGNANNTLWLANKIDLSSATSRTIQVDANVAILPGVIRNAAAGGLTKTGAGTLVLAGNNTYNGNTTITGGALIVGTTNNLGAAGAGLVFNGGGLRITGTSITNIAGIGHAVTFNNNQAVGFDIADAANTFTVDQVLNQGTGAFTKSGAGTLVLNQNNTFTGATTLYAGTLVLDYSTNNGSKLATAALNLNGGNLVLRGGSHPETVSSIVLGGATGNSISRDGGSTATIANAGVLTTGFLGNLAIAEAGIVSTTSANVNGIQSLGNVTVGSDFATKDGSNLLQAYSTYTPYTAGGGGGSGTAINQLTGGGTMSGILTSYALKIANLTSSDVLNLGANNLLVANSGTVLYAGGSSDNYTINGSGSVRTGSGNQSMTVNVFAGTLTVNAVLVANGTSSLAKAGTGTLVVGGPNIYNNSTYVQQGVLRLASVSGLGSTAGGTIVNGGAALELTNNITVGAEALTIAGAGISNGGALRNVSGAGNTTYGGAITIGGGGARINSDSGTLKLIGGIATTGGQDLTFGGAGNIAVSNSVVSGAGNLIKDGAGILELVITDSAVQSVCGDMTLNASTFQLTFAVAPSPTVAPLKIMGNLTFSGTPTIKVSVNPLLFTQGFAYPLLTVGGSKPETLPTVELVDVTGTLKWVGNTLFLAPQGTIISFH